MWGSAGGFRGEASPAAGEDRGQASPGVGLARQSEALTVHEADRFGFRTAWL